MTRLLLALAGIASASSFAALMLAPNVTLAGRLALVAGWSAAVAYVAGGVYLITRP